jgi:hypothetical protein
MPKTKFARTLTIGTTHSSGNHQFIIRAHMPGPAGDRVFFVADAQAFLQTKTRCRICNPALVNSYARRMPG